jgi:uncharacterized RDD family membrane protein YckC
VRATLYQAIGLSQNASDAEVRAALRGQIRKYYAKTRDGHGTVEEALRFINHASRILTDPERRAQYDQDLAAEAGTVDDRIAHVVTHAAGHGRIAPTFGNSAAIPSTSLSTRSRRGSGDSDRSGHHPGLTERVAEFGQSTAITVAICVAIAAVIAAAVALSAPDDALQATRQALIGLTVTLVALAIVYGVVHGIVWALRLRSAETPPLAPPSELAILNWRRQKTVFLGTSEPQEDASWVFQLRMAELERAKSGRTSEPHPWSRLGARLFDYAIWGLLVAALVAEARRFGLLAGTEADALMHPLVAPVLITFTWVPIEALLIGTVGTTPGKWLFGVYLQFSISDAYASRDRWAQLGRAWRRSLRVWWNGMGAGFPLLAPVLIAVAYEKVADHQESSWDFAEDCLVTHGPPGGLNVATGVAGLAAMLWLYGVAWHPPMTQSLAWARSAVVATLPSMSGLWQQGLAAGESIVAKPVALADRARAIAGEALRGASPARGVDEPAPPVDTPTPARSAPGARPPATAVAPAPGQRNTVAMVSVTPRAMPANAGGSNAPIDPEVAALFAARHQRIARLSTEGPRMVEARLYRQAVDVCREWADLELGNARAWRCLGRALEGQGLHQEAVAAFRKAKQYDPSDRTLDTAIARNQQGIVNDFLSRTGN